MKKIIAVFFVIGVMTASTFGSGILDQARIKQQMDLRWLVLEMSALSKLQEEHSILIDISIDAPFNSSRQEMDLKFVFRQRAGKSIGDHLRALEKRLRREVLGLYQIQVTTINQIRLLSPHQLQDALPSYTTQPGDVIILKPLLL